MRMRNLMLAVPLVASLFVTGQSVFAQPPRVNNPYLGRPRTSPYINLLRGGNQAILHRGLIRPQIEFNRFREQQSVFNQQFQSNLLRADRQGTGVSGHQAVFLNYSHYYSVGGRR